MEYTNAQDSPSAFKKENPNLSSYWGSQAPAVAAQDTNSSLSCQQLLQNQALKTAVIFLAELQDEGPKSGQSSQRPGLLPVAGQPHLGHLLDLLVPGSGQWGLAAMERLCGLSQV